MLSRHPHMHGVTVKVRQGYMRDNAGNWREYVRRHWQSKGRYMAMLLVRQGEEKGEPMLARHGKGGGKATLERQLQG